MTPTVTLNNNLKLPLNKKGPGEKHKLLLTFKSYSQKL